MRRIRFVHWSQTSTTVHLIIPGTGRHPKTACNHSIPKKRDPNARDLAFDRPKGWPLCKICQKIAGHLVLTATKEEAHG